MVDPIVRRSIEPCKKCMKDAGVDASKIDEVVLVGGQTRMPLIQNIVKELFGKEGHKGVNPDEVVAVGAAIQGGVLGGEVKDILLLDVTPLSLGVETLGGVMTVLIPRNTTIPTRKSETFSTASDSQTSVDIHILQGERPVASGNRSLGNFQLVGIPPAPRGLPQIEVTFDIDANGILNVSAKDKATSKEQKITITASTGLSKEEAERMRKEAESHADEDKKQVTAAEARNRADGLVYQTEKLVKENRDKLSESDAKAIESAIQDVRSAIAENNVERINAATEKLTQASHRVAEVLYQSQQAAASAGAAGGASDAGSQNSANGAGASGKQSDVVDAEFVDVDDSKKPN
jgi:molecular chaperone DnaK